MVDSILESVKLDLGLTGDCTDFDQQLIGYINSVFFVLWQMGLTAKPLEIHDSASVWTDIDTKVSEFNLIKTYVSQKVRYMFDPPVSGSAMESLNAVLKELETRLYWYAEYER